MEQRLKSTPPSTKQKEPICKIVTRLKTDVLFPFSFIQKYVDLIAFQLQYLAGISFSPKEDMLKVLAWSSSGSFYVLPFWRWEGWNQECCHAPYPKPLPWHDPLDGSMQICASDISFARPRWPIATAGAYPGDKCFLTPRSPPVSKNLPWDKV